MPELLENKFVSDKQRRWYFANRDKPKAKKKGGGAGGGGGARFANAADAEKYLKESGLVGKPELGGVGGYEATAIVEGLEAGLQAGDVKLRAHNVQVVDKMPVSSDQGGLGHSGGTIYITRGFLDKEAKNVDREATKKYLEGTGGERNFGWQDGVDQADAIRIAVAHEAGHLVDTALLLDRGKAARRLIDGGEGKLEEASFMQVSGYASTHPGEGFAEIHAFMRTGRERMVPEELRRYYQYSLEAADPEPIAGLIRNAAPLVNKFVSDKQRKWYFANRGREDVKSRAKGAASRAASLFGLPKPRVEFHSTGGEVFGEHGGDHVLIANPEKERNLGDTKVINFKPAPEVTDVEHVAAHEVIHQAFSQNPELGREMMDRLKNTKAEYGSAVSIYGSMAGSFENLMELGAVYTHSPRQLKKYSPEMYAIAADWSERLRGAVTNKFVSDKQRRWYFANADKGGQFGGGKKGVTVSPNLGIHPENARMIGETLTALGEKYGVSPEQMMTASMQGGNALGHHSTGRRRQVTPEEREALKARGVKTYGMDHPGSKQRRWFVFDPGHTLAFKSADSKGKPAGLGLPPDQLEKHMNSVKGLHARSGRPAAVDVATHEFAHILQHERGWKRADLNAPLSPAEQGTAKKISSYAATDRGELLAEAFVLFEGGNREPWVMDLVAQILPPTTNADPSPYGYCPICGAPGVERERRKDGNDRCANGHEYPSREAVGKPPVANKFVSDKQRRWYWSNLGKQGGPKEWRKGKAGGGAPRAFSMPGITTKPTDNGLTGEGEVDAQTRLAYLSISKMNGLTPDEVDGAHELEAMRVALEETRAFWTSNDPDARAIRRSDGLRSDPNSENSLNASLNIIMTADRENAGAGSGGPGSAKVFWTPYSMPDREGRLGPTYSHSLGVDPIYVLAHELHHAYGHGSEFDRASDVAAVAAHLRSGLKFNRKGVEDYLYTQVAVMQVYYGRSGDRGVRANETGRALRYLHNRFPEQLKQVLVGNILDEASWNQLLGQIQGIGKRRPAAT